MVMQRGFSLIELIVALVAAGIVAAGLMLWMARPLQALQDSHGQAAAIDQAERIGSRLSAELPQALPNSVRIACNGRCLEFLPVVAWGDYRSATPGDTLDFAVSDDRFDVLMPMSAVPQPGMQVVINNLNALPSGSGSAYSEDANNNRSSIVAGSTLQQIRMAPKQFPAPSAAQRFFIVDRPVSWFCQPAAGGGELRRYSGYPVQGVQPANPSSGDVFAGGIVDCAFDLTAPDLVTLRLQVGGPGGAQMGLLTQVALDHTP
jgi:MSHA biogenesis protein MshO